VIVAAGGASWAEPGQTRARRVLQTHCCRCCCRCRCCCCCCCCCCDEVWMTRASPWWWAQSRRSEHGRAAGHGAPQQGHRTRSALRRPGTTAGRQCALAEQPAAGHVACRRRRGGRRCRRLPIRGQRGCPWDPLLATQDRLPRPQVRPAGRRCTDQCLCPSRPTDWRPPARSRTEHATCTQQGNVSEANSTCAPSRLAVTTTHPVERGMGVYCVRVQLSSRTAGLLAMRYARAVPDGSYCPACLRRPELHPINSATAHFDIDDAMRSLSKYMSPAP